jgi:hypothetical protein
MCSLGFDTTNKIKGSNILSITHLMSSVFYISTQVREAEGLTGWSTGHVLFMRYPKMMPTKATRMVYMKGIPPRLLLEWCLNSSCIQLHTFIFNTGSADTATNVILQGNLFSTTETIARDFVCFSFFISILGWGGVDIMMINRKIQTLSCLLSFI